MAEIAHQPEHHFLEPLARQTLEKAPDQLPLDRALPLGDQQLRDVDAERRGHATQQQHGNVAVARFDLCEVTLGNL